MRTLTITSFARSPHQIAYTAKIDGRQFATSIWYDSVDFDRLEETYTPEYMRRVYFHVVAFDVNRLVSLQPDKIDFGCFSDLSTSSFTVLWRQVLTGVWGQWRYENDAPDYQGPEFTLAPGRQVPIDVKPGVVANLAFCGGGKDSLYALSLLEKAGEEFDTLAYSHAIYGSHEMQHQLIDKLLDCTRVHRRHRIWICDDFLSVPVLELDPQPGVRTITAAETPASAFLALPIALAHGFRRLILAHEKSADAPNFIWKATGEAINHQWGKSLDAERLLSGYIQSELLSNLHFFSLLKPVHDALIFSALRDLTTALPFAHSCNLQKPWCKRCAKCAYVWLNYAAWLPAEVVRHIFTENLFDIDANMIWFRQMLGLEEHTPFECVGEIDEARLAFALCRAKGYTGKAMALAHQPIESIDRLLNVAENDNLIPTTMRARVFPLFDKQSQSARDFLRSFNLLPPTH